MKRSLVLGVTVLLCAGQVVTNRTAAQETNVGENAAIEKLDEGRLDPSWFAGGEKFEFHRTGLFDYFWVNEDLTLEGRQLHLDRWEASRLPDGRDQRDRDKAAELRPLAPDILLGAFEKILKEGPRYSQTSGDIRVVGRFVDVNAGRMSAWVWPNFTIDLKLVDKKTGELLVAIHHRKVGQLKSHLKAWFRGLAKAIQKDLRTVYTNAEPAVGPP